MLRLGVEKLHAGVDLGHVIKTARTELEFQAVGGVPRNRGGVRDEKLAGAYTSS